MRLDLKKIQFYLNQKTIQPGTGLMLGFFRWLNAVFADYANIQALALWTAAIVTGLIATGYATVFRYLEQIFTFASGQYPLITFAITPLAFLVAWWLVQRFSREAGGSGIPQVMAAVETDYSSPQFSFVDRLLSLRTAGIKILGSLICVAGGGAIGREGPTLQISAAVFHFFGKQVRRTYPNSNEQTWVIAGAAAGLASAFNTPLGGIVYAIEELGISHFHRIRTALLSAVIISGLVAQTILGSYLYLGFPRLAPISAGTWPLVLLTGFVAGLMGALFSRTLLFLLRQRTQIRSLSKLALITVVCGTIAAALIFLEPSSSGPGTEIIERILFEGETANSTMTLSRIVATGAAYLSGVPGGIFSPSLTIGACIGSKIAYLFGSTSVNLLAMLGMIGFLTGITHAPFTAFILVVEMSDRHSAIFPMMVAALIASGVAKTIQRKSFYESVRDGLLAHQNQNQEPQSP